MDNNKKALARKFGSFLFIGILMMAGAALFNGLFIDLMGGPPEIIAPIVLFAFFILKYYAYVWFGVIHPRFVHYLAANIILTAFSAAVVPVLIINSPLNATTSTVVVMIGMAFFRFLVFKSIRLIRHEP